MEKENNQSTQCGPRLDDSPCSPFDLLMGQIEAMRQRSDNYRIEAEANNDIEEAETHMRVYMVLKELHRLGKHFEANTEGLASTAGSEPPKL